MLEYEGLCSAIAGCTGVEFVESAIKGTRNVLNACLKAKLKKVVVVSSVAAVMVNPVMVSSVAAVGATLNSANNWRFSLCCSPALFFFFHTLTPETAALQLPLSGASIATSFASVTGFSRLSFWMVEEHESAKKKRDGVLKKRKDANLKHVIISEKLDKKVGLPRLQTLPEGMGIIDEGKDMYQIR
ncbi:unnamed protein product [Camellia sinensis]